MPFALGARILNADTPERIKRLAEACAHPRAALRDFGGHKVREIKTSFVPAPKMEAAPEGEPPRAHRRAFSKSIFFELTTGGHSLAIGSSDIRADLMQHGGVIKPVKAKALTIPVSEKAYGKRARDFAGLVLLPAVGGVGGGFAGHYNVGRLARVRKKGSGRTAYSSIETLFILLRQVTIKPHPWLGVTDADWDYLGEALQRQTNKAAEGAPGETV